jgi:ATP-dependent Clp protease ATP-binding subunit ClpB
VSSFDGHEKASKEFLQVLDDGQGRVVDFRNTVIIFTSNVASAFLTEMSQEAVPPQIRTAVMNAIRATWPPEFLPSSTEHYPTTIRKIVEIRPAKVQQRIASRGMKLVLSEQAKEYLASIGYSPICGARPLQRVLTTELLNPLSVYILDDRVRDDESIKVEFDAQHNRLVIIPTHEGSGAADTMDFDDGEDGILAKEMD